MLATADRARTLSSAAVGSGEGVQVPLVVTGGMVCPGAVAGVKPCSASAWAPDQMRAAMHLTRSVPMQIAPACSQARLLAAAAACRRNCCCGVRATEGFADHAGRELLRCVHTAAPAACLWHLEAIATRTCSGVAQRVVCSVHSCAPNLRGCDGDACWISTTGALAARTIRLLRGGLFLRGPAVPTRDRDAWVQRRCSAGCVLCAQLPSDSQV